MEPDRREQIVASARSRINRQWVHQQADCRALITDVAAEFNVPYLGRTDYERAPDGVELLAECDRHLERITPAEVQSGDVVVIAFVGKPHHIGFLAPYVFGGLSLIHSSSVFGKVVEHRLSPEWASKIVAAYRIPNPP